MTINRMKHLSQKSGNLNHINAKKGTALLVGFSLFAGFMFSSSVFAADVKAADVKTAASDMNAMTEPKKEEAPTAKNLDVTIDIANTYIWRGTDIYGSAKALKSKAQESVYTIAPSLMPSLTYYSPVDGLSFNIWAALAATDRNLDSATGGGNLQSVDEIDYTLTYAFENKAGGWKFAYIYYAYPTSSSKTYGEMNFGYTAPVMLNPTIGVAVADDNGANTHYLTVGVSHELKLNDNFTFTPGLTWAYWINNGRDLSVNRGHIEVLLPLSYGINDNLSIHLNPLIVYRFLALDTTPGKEEAKIGTTTNEVVERTKIVSSLTLGVTYSF